MKFLSILLLLLVPVVCYGAVGDVASISGSNDDTISTISGATGSAISTIAGKNYIDGDSTEATPNVWGARCDDNAATNVVTAWVGSNGQLITGNTADDTSTDHYEGTRSFELATNNGVVSPSVALSGYSDLAFTVQIALKATTAFNASYYVRLLDFMDTSDYSEDIMVTIHGDTEIMVNCGGNEYTVTGLNDLSSGAWQVLRIVVNSGATHKIAVYQGATESALSLVAYNDNSISCGTVGTNAYPTFGGNGGDLDKSFGANGALIDDIKLWNTAVTP